MKLNFVFYRLKWLFLSQKSGAVNASVEKPRSLAEGTEKNPGTPKQEKSPLSRELRCLETRAHPTFPIYPFHKASPYYSCLLTECKLL